MPAHYQLPVLLYHRVINNTCVIGRHKIYVREKKFRAQMQWLKDNGYETLTFRGLDQISSDKKQIIITFDDGYEDNYTILFPILKEFGFTAVIFLVTDCKQNDWGIREGEPAVNMMNAEQIREMDAYGIEFGGHTQHHVALKHVDVDVQRREIEGCFSDLKQLLGKEPVSFSYPYGAYNDETLKLTPQAGFRYGITTIFGPDEWKKDLFRIRRLEVSPKSTMFTFPRKASGHYFQTNWLSYFFSK